MGSDQDTDQTPFRIEQDGTLSIEIDRGMYEELRSTGSYLGETADGVDVCIREDFQSVGRSKHPDDTPDTEAWGPLFPVADESTPGAEPAADPDSKTVMLEAVPEDTIQITSVHSGMHRLPERLTVVRRTNTYYGPALRLRPADEADDGHPYELTCPGRESHLLLSRAVTDADGYVHSWTKIATVSAEIFTVDGYDLCESCGEPIKDPMHRSLAMLGECPGGLNDGE